MEKMAWMGLIIVIGVTLTTISGPAFGAQLAINANNPMLFDRSTTNPWVGEIIEPHFRFDPSGEIFTLESGEMGMGIMPSGKNRSQWEQVPYNAFTFSSETAAQGIFGTHSTPWAHHWNAEDIFSNNTFFSSKDSETEEETDTSGLPPLPSALWLCGFGIMGILCVRRTNDHSNVS